jgi:hypothetical protein
MHVLKTPTEVRHAVPYAIRNYASHAARAGRPVGEGFADCFSSAARADLCMPPEAWLLREGWRRGAPTSA